MNDLPEQLREQAREVDTWEFEIGDRTVKSTAGFVMRQAAAEIERLREELEAWRCCVKIDVCMQGPVLMGTNRSELQRVFNKYWSVKSEDTGT